MAPTLTYDDIASFIHATSIGETPTRTLKFYKDSVGEDTVISHIQGAADYLHFFLGDAIWNTADPVRAAAVLRLLKLYASSMVLSVLSGGLIITGFNVSMAELTMGRSERFTVYHSLVATFMAEAKTLAIQLTQFRLSKAGGCVDGC